MLELKEQKEAGELENRESEKDEQRARYRAEERVFQKGDIVSGRPMLRCPTLVSPCLTSFGTGRGGQCRACRVLRLRIIEAESLTIEA